MHLTEPQWVRADTSPAGELQPNLDDMFLARGFTTAVDLGSDPRSTNAVKARVASRELAGPRLLSAGAGIYPPRGLPFYLADDIPRYLRLLIPQPRSAKGARRAVRRSQRNGAQVAKLFTGSYVRRDQIKPMPGQVAQAAAQLAKKQGRLVFAHVSNAEGLRIALEAGVDVIAHVPDSPKGTHPLLQEAARRGIWMVPTLDMFAQTGSRSPEFLEPIYEALNVFREAGGRLLFGTDVGYLPDRSTQGEFAALEACGLTVTEVLGMLTTAPAEALGVGSGRLVEGQPADLVVLEHRELCSPSQYAQVQATIREGQILWTRGSADFHGGSRG